MKRQLQLIETSNRPEWRLDPKTRRAGRVGVTKARIALERARSVDQRHVDPGLRRAG